jgi:hypothetical protein
MRSTLTAAVAVLALAFSTGTAFAGTNVPPDQVDAANHALTMRSLARLRQQVDVQVARIASPPRTAPATTARLVPTDRGFSWADGAVGAGVTAALLLAAAGVQSARRRPITTAR